RAARPEPFLPGAQANSRPVDPGPDSNRAGPQQTVRQRGSQTVSNDSIWDDKEIQSSGSYVKLTEKSDSIEGRILKIVKRTFTATRKGEEDSVSPELTLECADG